VVLRSSEDWQGIDAAGAVLPVMGCCSASGAHFDVLPPTLSNVMAQSGGAIFSAALSSRSVSRLG
jgi:hypothetical protein